MNNVKSVYHGECGLRMMKELAPSYLTITQDLTRVMNRLKALSVHLANSGLVILFVRNGLNDYD